jgi:hypothetical protein
MSSWRGVELLKHIFIIDCVLYSRSVSVNPVTSRKKRISAASVSFPADLFKAQSSLPVVRIVAGISLQNVSNEEHGLSSKIRRANRPNTLHHLYRTATFGA